MRFRLLVLLLIAPAAGCGAGVIRPAEGGGAAPSPAAGPVSEPAVGVTDPASPAPAPSAPEPQAYGEYTGGTELEIRRIGRWIHSGISGTRRLVIRDPATFNRFWAELGAGVQPQVDFSRDLVIAAASGPRPSGGHEIAVVGVSRHQGELRIEVAETSPGAGCAATGALTQPVDVVVVQADGITGWSFVDRRLEQPCQ